MADVKKGPEGPFCWLVGYSSSSVLKIKKDRKTSALQIRFVSMSMGPPPFGGLCKLAPPVSVRLFLKIGLKA
jgi:hypothetical protein